MVEIVIKKQCQQVKEIIHDRFVGARLASTVFMAYRGMGKPIPYAGIALTC